MASYYTDNSTMNCSSCYTNCYTCINATFCTLCNINYYLLNASSNVGVN